MVTNENQHLFEGFRSTIERMHIEDKIDINADHYKCLKSLGSISADKFKSIRINLEIQPYIDAIHNNLKDRDIFLWKEGDIEEIFGFTEKKERQWQQFRKDIVLDEKELEDIVKHYDSLSKMIDWMDT